MGDPRTRDAEWREVLDLHFEKHFQKYHAPIQGLINKYTHATQLADVQVVVKLTIEGIEETVAPILRGVSVAFPGGRDHSHTWPLFPGDGMTLIPQDADVGAYLASGVVFQQPRSTRRFSLSDAIGFPLVARPQGAVLPPEALAADGAVLHGLTYVGSSLATDFAPMAAKVKTEIDSLITAFNKHSHPTAATGPPSIPTPDPAVPVIPVVSSGSTASTKLKVI